ncbi:hypothetical protein V1512DRAFT_258475 [Lipomyces arxii]|uniref:uncharacterized protein n=1 Tax=Lipomyces arxii TaxID=56418 RepID=UPI0034CD6AA3
MTSIYKVLFKHFLYSIYHICEKFKLLSLIIFCYISSCRSHYLYCCRSRYRHFCLCWVCLILILNKSTILHLINNVK